MLRTRSAGFELAVGGGGPAARALQNRGQRHHRVAQIGHRLGIDGDILRRRLLLHFGCAKSSFQGFDRRADRRHKSVGRFRQTLNSFEQSAVSLFEDGTKPFRNFQRRDRRCGIHRLIGRRCGFHERQGAAQQPGFDRLGRQPRDHLDQRLGRDVDRDPGQDCEQREPGDGQGSRHGRDRAWHGRQRAMFLRGAEYDAGRQHDQRTEEVRAGRPDVIEPRDLAPRLMRLKSVLQHDRPVRRRRFRLHRRGRRQQPPIPAPGDGCRPIGPRRYVIRRVAGEMPAHPQPLCDQIAGGHQDRTQRVDR